MLWKLFSAVTLVTFACREIDQSAVMLQAPQKAAAASSDGSKWHDL